jgi:hypothetical protein
MGYIVVFCTFSKQNTLNIMPKNLLCIILCTLLFISFSSQAQFTISATGPTDVCFPSSVTLVVDNPIPGNSYSWWVGSYSCNMGTSSPVQYAFGSSTIQALGTGEFYCVSTGPGGIMEISNPVVVRVLPGSIGSILLPAPFPTSPVNCQSSVSMCVPWVFYQNFPGTQIRWFFNNSLISGATAASYNATVSGWYKYSITSSCIQAFSDSVEVIIPPGTPLIFGSQPTPACAGNVVTFNILNVEPGVSYLWEVSVNGGTYQPAGTNSTLNYTIPAASSVLVRARITSNGCNQVSNIITIQIQNIVLTSSPGTPLLLCFGASGVISATTSYLPPPSFQWYRNGVPVPGANLQTLTVTQGGIYKMAASAACGVVWSNDQVVKAGDIPQAIVTAGGPTEFCSGGNVLLSASVGPGYTYQWKKYGNLINGATSSTYLAKRTGKYRAIITDSVGCVRATNTVSVNVYPYPTAQVTALGATDICQGDSVVMVANQDPGNTYQWKRYTSVINGATGPVYTASNFGKYKCVVTNQYGCARGSNQITVNIVCRDGESPASQNDIQIYPNPSNGEFYIDNPSGNSPYNFTLLDNMGRVVDEGDVIMEGTSYKISGLSSGMYMLILRSDAGTQTHRVLVNH